jgi:hypothetical protein
MSKFLSLDWFKSKVEQAVENVISRKIDKLIEQEECSVPEKPYMNIKLVNTVLTIVLTDGNIISKQNATQQDFIDAKKAKCEDELFALVVSAEVVSDKKTKQTEIRKARALLAGLEVLKNYDEFVVDGASVYFKGINRSIPQVLLEEILNIVNEYDGDWTQDEEYQSLKRFFMWCCLNPRAEVADELYRFLKDNSFRITKQGFFVALRNVVTVNEKGLGSESATPLVDFISNAYNKIKAVWKKKPKEYYVFDHNGEYSLDKNLGKGKCLGSLEALYLDLPNMSENRFTDDWTKTFDIRIGKVVSMPKEECNWSTQDCAAAGLN